MTEKCKKKGHISRLHPSFLRLGLQILGFARFCSVEWARGAVEEPGERVSGGVCTFKVNWSDERGALGLAVAPIIHLVMSPASGCACSALKCSLLSDPAVRPLGREEGGYGLSGWKDDASQLSSV